MPDYDAIAEEALEIISQLGIPEENITDEGDHYLVSITVVVNKEV